MSAVRTNNELGEAPTNDYLVEMKKKRQEELERQARAAGINLDPEPDPIIPPEDQPAAVLIRVQQMFKVMSKDAPGAMAYLLDMQRLTVAHMQAKGIREPYAAKWLILLQAEIDSFACGGFGLPLPEQL